MQGDDEGDNGGEEVRGRGVEVKKVEVEVKEVGVGGSRAGGKVGLGFREGGRRVEIMQKLSVKRLAGMRCGGRGVEGVKDGG